MSDLAEVLIDLRYYVSLGRVDQAQVYATDFGGSWARELGDCIENGRAVPCTLSNEEVVLVGLVFGHPHLVAQLPHCQDAQFMLEVAPIVEMFYDRGYL
jgi:hypothetical protein